MAHQRKTGEAIRVWRQHGAVQAIAKLHDIDLNRAGSQLWPDNPALALKAASSPASMGGWGQQLSATANGEFLAALQGRSAAAALFERTLEVDLSGIRAVNLPRTTSAWPAPAWIAEGGAFPVQTGAFGSDLIGPLRKIGCMTVITNELANLSGPAAENVIGDLMLDAAGRYLDSHLFSNTAAGANSPAGILAGVSATTAAGATGSRQDRAITDIAALTAAIAAGGGGARVAFFGSQSLAVSAKALVGIDVIPIPGLAAGTIIAVDLGAFAWAGEFPPEIETAPDGTLHMDTAAADALSATATPNTIVAPVRSLYQTDSIALRMRLPITWAKRSATAVQFISSVNW